MINVYFEVFLLTAGFPKGDHHLGKPCAYLEPREISIHLPSIYWTVEGDLTPESIR